MRLIFFLLTPTLLLQHSGAYASLNNIPNQQSQQQSQISPSPTPTLSPQTPKSLYSAKSALENFYKNKINPAVNSANTYLFSTLFQFFNQYTTETIIPSAQQARNNLNEFTFSTALPALLSSTQTMHKKLLIPFLTHTSSTFKALSKDANLALVMKSLDISETELGPAFLVGVKAVEEFRKGSVVPVFEGVESWVRENPRFTAVLVGSGVLVLCPGLIAGPLVGGFGVGEVGVGSGTAAAMLQSQIGNIVAGSSFAVVQSAGMGGAGTAVVNGFVVGGAAAVGAGTAVLAFMEGVVRKQEVVGLIEGGEKDGKFRGNENVKKEEEEEEVSKKQDENDVEKAKAKARLQAERREWKSEIRKKIKAKL